MCGWRRLKRKMPTMFRRSHGTIKTCPQTFFPLILPLQEPPMPQPDDTHLTPVVPADAALAHAGQVANEHAARNVFTDYLSRKADNTIRRHAADLARFVEFLQQVGEQAGIELGAAMSLFARTIGTFPDGPSPDAEAWRGVTWGLVEAFRNWMVGQGDAVGSINVRLS